ncbi:hypothetical protein H6A24_06575 [Bacteroides caecicola]|uniref:Uncharacterized protein n=1 Tax=Bacteroides caecicola TaxID=1462569 RepID=A0ABS2F7F0_9BACE|nr:hypothetical protein [Bacteroides caecicola]MBM6806167.1 hypothetical protein [Bacteroides caecicola]
MERNVIIIMIGCATLIAIVAIICDFLNNKNSQTSAENLLTQKIIKLHRNYIVGFLSFAIITIISAKYGGPNNNIFDYLSFGSTITSLVLSILAIFVTVQSSSDLYKQFTRIDNATDTITQVSKQIDKTLEGLLESKDKLVEASNTITKQIDNIVLRVDEKLQERMKETEHNIAEQINSLNGRNNTMYNDGKIELGQFKEGYLNSASAVGLLLLYSCTLSMKEKKGFPLLELFKGNEQYSFGFFISSISSGIISATNDNQYVINCTNSIFQEEELLDKLKSMIPNFGESFQNQINTVNSYFGRPTIS